MTQSKRNDITNDNINDITTNDVVKLAFGRAQKQQCLATQDRCLLGIFVYLRPIEH